MCCVVLFLLCVCVCDLFLFDMYPRRDYDPRVGKRDARLWVGLTSAAVAGGFVWARALVVAQLHDLKRSTC